MNYFHTVDADFEFTMACLAMATRPMLRKTIVSSATNIHHGATTSIWNDKLPPCRALHCCCVFHHVGRSRAGAQCQLLSHCSTTVGVITMAMLNLWTGLGKGACGYSSSCCPCAGGFEGVRVSIARMRRCGLQSSHLTPSQVAACVHRVRTNAARSPQRSATTATLLSWVTVFTGTPTC